ncbi:hypothetical protein JOD69_001012 [Methylocaldum sp. RMAD-M]|jgi:hypothetical protein|nr:hypothetical protein [Methylocaldum sp. RMAD-M]
MKVRQLLRTAHPIFLALPLLLMGCERSEQQPSMPPKELTAPTPAPDSDLPKPNQTEVVPVTPPPSPESNTTP